ncbi:conserved Plasmodium protein, unknown function [Plasmodium relictum]|uniref:Gamma tubulin complex component protein N-terminal domain-containing protein n=1 Tax=Plasmodium relictum TaxID=85471 RepID=A0A1J1H5Q2_PLARL|nr:conserved Plasmodium protein, unknown function [Plasmodium relictum]CRG98756.1 conserved Plasmodium protein, unknown function [Plasmodium relictum]
MLNIDLCEKKKYYLNKEIKKYDYVNLSLLNIIDHWCDIETSKYPIKNERILRKIKLDIKKFIYANILYKTKTNFNLFNKFYNYKYNYDIKYVNNQYLFDICSNSYKYFYELLKRYYKEKKKCNLNNYNENSDSSLEIINENKTDNLSNLKNIKNDLIKEDKSDDVNKNLEVLNLHNNRNNYIEYTDDFFDISNRKSNSNKNRLVFTELYTSMVYYCFLLMKNKYYFDFICLYLYFKCYFSIDELMIKKNTVLKFTCHEHFLNLLFLLSSFLNNLVENDVNIKNKFDYNELKNFYNFDIFNENINIGNVSKLSFNLLLNLRVRINFNEINYDLNIKKYKNICNFILLFQNEFTKKYIMKLNEMNNLTLKYKQYIFKKEKNNNDPKFSNDNSFPIDNFSFLSLNNTNDDNSNNINNCNNNRLRSYTDENFSKMYLFNNEYNNYFNVKEKFYNNFNIFDNNKDSSFYNEGNNISVNNNFSIHRNNNNNTFIVNKDIDEKTLKTIFLEENNLIREYNNRNNNNALNIKHSNFNQILSFNIDDIYKDELELHEMDYININDYCKNEREIENINNAIDIFYEDMNIFNDNLINSNKNEDTFIWLKSFMNDTYVLKILERKIVIDKKEKYKNYFLSIINSIYVTLHKNIISSINNRIEEYRFLILKRFFFLCSKNYYNKFNDTLNWKYKILNCLLGYENEIFSCSYVNNNKNIVDIYKEKIQNFRNGCIYISKNIICVDKNIAFWINKKNNKIFHLYFKPFQNYFSSYFYQKYLHIFIYISKIGTLIRYIKIFILVFTKIIYKKKKYSNSMNILTKREKKDTNVINIKKEEKKKKKKNDNDSYYEEEIPLGKVFISFINSIRKYLLIFEERMRNIILQEHIKSPLDIYYKIKKHTECIEFLSFLCSSYTYGSEIFYKKYYKFYKNPFNYINNSSIEKCKQLHEYNYFSNIIYGLSHKNYERKNLKKRKEKSNDMNEDNKINEILHSKVVYNEKDDFNKYLSKKIYMHNYNLFIYPRGNELLSYIYRYYYLFLNTNKKNLIKLCNFIFLRIIKPFLHFLYSYVYMGLNKDYYFEYIINKNALNQFFYIYHNNTKYYDKTYLLNNSFISLPVFFKYSIEIVYYTGILSRILRMSSEEDFYLAIPKIIHYKNIENEISLGKKKEYIKEDMSGINNIKKADIVKLLCSFSINKIINFLNFYNDSHYKKIEVKNEKSGNVFIKYWNNEKVSKVVYEKTKRNINKKLQYYFLRFYSILNDHIIDLNKITKHNQYIKNRNAIQKISQVKKNENKKICKLVKLNSSKIINKKSRLKEEKCRFKNIKKIHSYKDNNFRGNDDLEIKKVNKYQNKSFTSYENLLNGIPFENSLLIKNINDNSNSNHLIDNYNSNNLNDNYNSDDLSEYSDFEYSNNSEYSKEKFNNDNIKKTFDFSANINFSDSSRTDRRNDVLAFNINYCDDEKLENVVEFNKKRWSKNDMRLLYIEKEEMKLKKYNNSTLNEIDHIIKEKENKKYNKKKKRKCKFEIKSINYLLYRNLFIPINHHYDNINKILVYSFLINKNLLIYLCLLKCYLFCESDRNYKFLCSLLYNKKNKDVNTKKLYNIYNKKKVVYYYLDKNFYKAKDISTKFFYINFRVIVPYTLRIFFDEDIINYYNSIYKLTSLFYFTLNNLNDIFLIFSTYSKPFIYQHISKEEKCNKMNYNDFKYMHIIENIANKNNLNEENIYEQKCIITKNLCNVFMTKKRFFNVGFHKKFLYYKKMDKFLENVKIFNEILNDFNKIRCEMKLIINYIYDYLINMNIHRNYFFFFHNILKIKKFYDLIKFHKSFVQHIFKFSFLSTNFFSISKIIFNIINIIDILKNIMNSLIPFLHNKTEASFSFIFDKNFKILENNIIILTSVDAQNIIKKFYINRDNLIIQINKFQNNKLDYIYNKFFFNDYYTYIFQSDCSS